MAINRMILVTGGAQGIGKGIAELLLLKKYSVVICDIDEEAGRETQNELIKSGEVHFIHTDVSSELSVSDMVRNAAKIFHRIDGLVNNAGIAKPYNAPMENVSLDMWNKIVGTNLTGTFLCSKYCIPELRKSSGSIVNVSSTRAIQSEAHTEAYSASKGGIVALTHAMAISLGPAIRVNCVSPGWIDVTQWKKKSARTKVEISHSDHAQHPVGRVGLPQDIAEITEFLLSSRAGFITGQNVVVDGGMTKKMVYAE
jgi:NAD(P)-dependent dehydrogenase (short-subunit alcohol dehydrogenase family)